MYLARSGGICLAGSTMATLQAAPDEGLIHVADRVDPSVVEVVDYSARNACQDGPEGTWLGPPEKPMVPSGGLSD